MDRKMFDTPILPRLESILAEVKAGELLVPEFQRPFVWDDDLRVQLLDSIAAGMPIGSLLVWRTGQRELNTYATVGGIRIAAPASGVGKLAYLIDGHQRISTLFGALQPLDDDQAEPGWRLYYELGAEGRPAFRVAPRRGTVPDHFLPLHILFDGDRLFEFTQRLRERGQRQLAKDAERLANLFRDYIVPVVPLVTEDLDVVTDAFVRINSLGRAMTEAHMLRALTHLSQVNSDDAFGVVRASLAELGWGDIEDGILVKVLKAVLGLDVYAAHVRELREALRADPTLLSRLPDILKTSVEMLIRVGVRGPRALPYAHQLVTLAAFCATQTEAELASRQIQDRVKRWFWITTYTERFKGITGDRLRREVQGLVDGREPDEGAARIVRPLGELRRGTVRSEAFLLFLAQLPQDPEARQRRQEWLELEKRQLAVLFPQVKEWPEGNCVLATPSEVRALRAALVQGAVSEEQADEFSLPSRSLPDLVWAHRFVEARAVNLMFREREFIESLGPQLREEI